MKTLTLEQSTKTIAHIYRALGPVSYGIIYLLINQDNGKLYIGQTTAIVPYSRYWGHLDAARRGNNKPLYAAIRKYGEDAFKFETLASCDDQVSLDLAERYFIRIFNSLVPNGYNLKDGGNGGKSHPDSIKKAIESNRIANLREDVKERRRIAGVTAMEDPIILERVRIGLARANAKPIVIKRRGDVTRDGKWITNGTNNKRLKPGNDIPLNWYYGRHGIGDIIKAALDNLQEKERRSLTTSGRIWINDGIINRRVLSLSDIPNGWSLGQIVRKSLKRSQVTGRHTRWHVARGKRSEDCPLCRGEIVDDL